MFKLIIAGLALAVCTAGTNAMPSFKSLAARQVGPCQMANCQMACCGTQCTSCDDACAAACGGCCGK